MAKNNKVKTQAIQWSPFSLKGMQSIKYADAFINIYEGAVRSSKTVCSTIAWIKFLEESPHQYFLMTGKTEDTCYRNMIGGATGMIAIAAMSRSSGSASVRSVENGSHSRR